MKPSEFYVVLNGFNKSLWDVALSLDQAKHRGLQHVHKSPLELHWAINNNGRLAAYTLDDEHCVIEIAKYGGYSMLQEVVITEAEIAE